MKQFILLAGFVSLATAALAQGTAFTYQGRLDEAGTRANGSYDLTFALFNVSSGAGQIGVTITNTPVGVTNGLFTLTLDFGNQFPGADRWLEIAVRTNGGGAFATLNPRQQITPTPYAIRAESLSGTLPLSQLPSGVVTNNGTGVLLSGAFSGDGSGLTNLNVNLSAGFWKTNGNAGANPTNGAFLGTTDNQPLEFKVNGQRAARLEPISDSAYYTNIVNVVLGSSANHVQPGVVGATISGGGADYYSFNTFSNKITGDFGTVGGGGQNTAGLLATISGGERNTVVGMHSTVGGGQQNSIEANASNAVIGGGTANSIQSEAGWSTIGGGLYNAILFDYATYDSYTTIGGGSRNTNAASRATIAGGDYNEISIGSANGVIGGGAANIIQLHGANATIGGGVLNTVQSHAANSTIDGGYLNLVRSNALAASIGGGEENSILIGGQYATIPGGRLNTATNYAFAAGQRAKANHTGAFVWADSQNADFASTTNNQFAVRAQNGMVIQVATNATALELKTGGAIKVTGAGLFTGTPVFIHRAVPTNISGSMTFIDHPLSNGDSNAILIVTANWNPGGTGGVYNTNTVGVYYSAPRWAIFNQSGLGMVTNSAYNVLVVKQ